MILQRILLMSWELMLNVQIEKPSKCVAFKASELHLNYSSIAISTNLDSALVTTKSIIVLVDISRRRIGYLKLLFVSMGEIWGKFYIT